MSDATMTMEMVAPPTAPVQQPLTKEVAAAIQHETDLDALLDEAVKQPEEPPPRTYKGGVEEKDPMKLKQLFFLADAKHDVYKKLLHEAATHNVNCPSILSTARAQADKAEEAVNKELAAKQDAKMIKSALKDLKTQLLEGCQEARRKRKATEMLQRQSVEATLVAAAQAEAPVEDAD